MKNFIIETLNKYFPNPKITLNYKSFYELLIATMLSAQTKDITVNKVTKLLFKKAKSPFEMVKLSLKEIEEIIKPCGLFKKKAAAILKISEILIKKYTKKMPNTFEELEALPLIGHKTASVIVAEFFKKAAFPVDTHIKRLAVRWKITDKKDVVGIEKDLKKFFEKKLWMKLHLQMIFFGRKYCKAKGHNLKNCPICSVIEKSS